MLSRLREAVYNVHAIVTRAKVAWLALSTSYGYALRREASKRESRTPLPPSYQVVYDDDVTLEPRILYTQYVITQDEIVDHVTMYCKV